MERSLTILIQFQVSFLKVRRIQQSSQFEPCVVFFAAKVREFCRRVSNLILVCLQTLPKCVEDFPSQAGVKNCTNIAQKMYCPAWCVWLKLMDENRPLHISTLIHCNVSWVKIKTLPKAQRTRGLSSGYQGNFLRSYHKFSKKS